MNLEKLASIALESNANRLILLMGVRNIHNMAHSPIPAEQVWMDLCHLEAKDPEGFKTWLKNLAWAVQLYPAHAAYVRGCLSGLYPARSEPAPPRLSLSEPAFRSVPSVRPKISLQRVIDPWHVAEHAIAAGLSRDNLLARLPLQFVASLPTQRSPWDQMTSDLHRLVETPEIIGLEVPPLQIWLENAVSACALPEQEEPFQLALDRVLRACA